MSDADRLSIGANFPPETTPVEVVAEHWNPRRLVLDYTAKIEAWAALLEKATACATVGDALAAELAAGIIRDIRRAEAEIERIHGDEKAPVLAAGRVVDQFKAAQINPLGVHKIRLDRLIGAHQAAVAAEERRKREKAADEERQRAIELAAEAAAAEAANKPATAAILMDHAIKSEDVADIHDRAATQTHDLGRVQSEAGTIGLKLPWVHEIEDAEALRATLGPLGRSFTLDAVNAAIKAYIRANTSDRQFIGKALPGVRIYQDVRGNVR